jgi:hypothetical protein
LKGQGIEKRFVELGVWYKGQNELIREFRETKGKEVESWSLALALARRLMVRNQGQMRVDLEAEVTTAIRLWFPVAKETD